MKIVIDARFLSVPGMGITSYIEGLTNGIIDSKGHLNDEYVFLVPSGFERQNKNIKFETSNIPVVTMKQHLMMPFYLQRLKPDVYHYPHFDLPFAYKTLSVITIHDLKYIKFPELFYRRSKEKSFIMRAVMKNSIKRSKKVITVSERTKYDIVNILKVSPDKIEVIYESCDSYFRVLSTSHNNVNVLEKLGIKLPFILFVGMHRPHKNLCRLLEAFKHIKYKNYSLVTVGRKYRDYDEPFELIEKLGLKNRVKHLSFVTKEVLLHLYNAATVFIFPSLYEGFGIPVLEAMACGTPVITSNISSLPEVAGNAAMLVNPYDVGSITDALNRILGDLSLQQRLREKGLKRAKEFSWSKAARETLKVYKEINRFIPKRKK